VRDEIPAISGKQLIRLFRPDDWEQLRRVRHGIAFARTGPDGNRRVTVIPDKRGPLPAGTLAAILGPRQSGLGRDGLLAMIQRHGLK
jgi:hypothetical protein